MQLLDSGQLSTTVTGFMDFCVTPAHYKCFHIDKQKDEKAVYTKGRLLHLAVFEPEIFERDYYSVIKVPEEFTVLKTVSDFKAYLETYEVPFKKASTKGDLITLVTETIETKGHKNYIVWDEYVKQFDDKTEIPEKLYQSVLAMADSVRNNIFFKAYLDKGQKEQKLVGTIGGVQFRGRLDWFLDSPVENSITVVDLKSTQSAKPRAFRYSIGTYNYWIQSFIYCNLIKQNFGKDTRYIYGAVESQAPYICESYVHHSNHADMEAVELYLLNKIEEFKKCVETNHWYGYTKEGLSTIETPDWVLESMGEQYE